MLQFITHNTHTEDYAPELDQIRQALEGGCRWIQLRKKGASKPIVRNAVRNALLIVRQYPDAKLIVDDHVDIALETGADGVHLGKNDMPVAEARALARSFFQNDSSAAGFIIGATANELADIEKASAAGADYIGLGPLRFTATKTNLSPVLGYEGYRRIMQGMRQKNISLPVVAIGSVSIDDIAPLMEAGVSGVAVSGAITSASHPVKATYEFVNQISKHHNS